MRKYTFSYNTCTIMFQEKIFDFKREILNPPGA